ncbi:MAG: hypothetical protein IJ733_15050 [Lachnospiraceae bacterium]|nr:hypothetical protein [Lachnospiraceae bacterium]
MKNKKPNLSKQSIETVTSKQSKQMTTSKGNQLKFLKNSFWYKIDNLGYEGAAEFIASEILKLSNISNFVEYHLCEIKYHERTFHGCKSKDFLKDRRDTQIISVARLHEKFSSTDLDTALKKKSTRDQIDYLVNFVTDITGLQNFGVYLTKILELDTLILNDDRHFNNICILENGGFFSLCPVFDNGGAFLSDTKYDYPLEKNSYGLIHDVKAKPFSTDFDAQLQACHALYGSH